MGLGTLHEVRRRGWGGLQQGERDRGLRPELEVSCKSFGNVQRIWGWRHWGCSWLPRGCVWRGSWGECAGNRKRGLGRCAQRKVFWGFWGELKGP